MTGTRSLFHGFQWYPDLEQSVTSITHKFQPSSRETEIEQINIHMTYVSVLRFVINASGNIRHNYHCNIFYNSISQALLIYQACLF